MDSMTHIHFAANLLQASGHDYSAIDCALFPQIDRKPAYYHRLYAHSIPKAELIAVAARDVYWDAYPTVSKDDYLRSRLLADRDRIRSYTVSSPFPQHVSRVPSTTEIVLAFVSHIYNDQFNNPVQAFVPYSVYPSGAWKLWEAIDSAEFRWHLYEKNTIDRFREEVFAGSEWTSSVPAEALIAGMIVQLAKACPRELETNVVLKALQAVHVEDAYKTNEYKDALELLCEHEHRVIELIKKYSTPRSQSGPRRWAGYGY